MMALSDDCIELRAELSRHHMREIECIVRDSTRAGANPSRNLPETNGSGGHSRMRGFQSQPELMLERRA